MKVRMEHVRRAGMCSKGARAFVARHGLNWREFLDRGLEASVIRATGDAMARRVADIAEGKDGQQQ